MLIILEGLDKTGKSTLAETLLGILDGADLRHCERPAQHPLLEYESGLDDYAPGTGQHIIYDRYHWGEMVWPTIYDRPTVYTDEMHMHVELFLRSRGAVVVYCTAPPSRIHDLLVRDADPYPPPESIIPALELFGQTKAKSILDMFTYDYGNDHGLTRDDTAKAIISLAWYQENQVFTLNSVSRHWVGYSDSEVLLVGDRPGPKIPDQNAVPFRPFGGTSGAYLMRAIVGLSRPAITNALDSDGSDTHLRKLWRLLDEPPVIALGAAASKGLKAFHIPHVIVPHPQWVRRFHHSHLNDYQILLREAARGRAHPEVTKTWRMS